MRNLFFREKKNKNSGFTLVEMIVVLVILGILASAAVYSIISYINLSRFRSNNENALSVYQSAQAAVNHMEKAGTSDKLATDIIAKGTASPFNNQNADGIDNIYNSVYFDSFPTANNAPGESAHMRFAVTYTPGGNDDQSKLIKDLISADFSSTDLFNGIITIEFDVEKMLNNLGTVDYSVNVYSAFYDIKRKNWSDAAATHNGISGVVPYRDEDYRFSDSYIGYCNGNSTPTAVDSVLLPDDSEIKSTIVTLRNGETLDLTWSATAEGLPITGVPSNIHYIFSLYDYDQKEKQANNKICDLVVTEYSILDNLTATSPSGINWYEKLAFEKKDFIPNNIKNLAINGVNYPVVYTSETVRDRRGVQINIYKATIKTTAKVYLHRVTNPNALDNFVTGYNNLSFANLTQPDNYYTFPLTISYEIHEGDGVADRISYTLSLDAMMSRNIYNYVEKNSSAIRTLNYSFNRLYKNAALGTKVVPKNIYAEMVMAPNNFKNLDSTYNDASGFTQSDVFLAERALDDPVYLNNDGTYSYLYNLVDKDRGKKYAVVNSYFGDLGNGTFGSDKENSAEEVSAIITSYRHLSNMRLLRDYDHPVRYSICRDLNWYTIGNGNTYNSEVVVYSGETGDSELTGHSPVHWPVSSEYTLGYGSYRQRLDVVSFPSIPHTQIKSTLIAEDNTLAPSDAADKTSVINNVQMRLPSFYDTDKNSYGLICTNNGHIINIRANGLTLILDNLPDGSPDDREKIKDAVEQLRNPNTTVRSTATPAWQPSSPVGGFVGANSGIIGSETETDINKNTFRFSNCVVMSGHWEGSEWVVFRTSAVGIIIGDNNGPKNDTTRSAYGLLETTGMFASTGYVDVSGAIGFSKADIDALIRVDNTKDVSKKIIEFKNNVSSLIFCTSDAMGGAIGSVENSAISQSVSATPFTLTADTMGRIQSAPGLNPVYAIDVKLDSNSYVVCKTDDKPKISTTDDPASIEAKRPSGFGGAIGRLTGYRGDILSISVENNGLIISSAGTTYAKCLGGAIGIIFNGTISNAYIKVVNNGQIGSDTTYANSTGGAVGRINNLNGATGTVNIDVINNGQISGNSTKTTDRIGIGGAVGSIVATNKNISSMPNMPFYNIISVNNGTISGKTITQGGNEGTNNYGVGGAVGHIQLMPTNSVIYCLNTSGSSVTANGNNAGGCLGNQCGGMCRNPGTTNTTITANLQNGVSVTATGANAGGCIGNSGCVNGHMQIRTIVTGTVSVTASSDAGGIAGRFKVASNNETSNVYLLTQTSGSAINIKAAGSASSDPIATNENAGGLFGLVSDGSNTVGFGVGLNMPSQTGSNVLIVRVDSYDNAGGMIGDWKHSGAVSPAMNVVLHPSSYVHAHNDNAGGLIGLLEGSKTISSNMTVCDAAVTSTDTPFVMAGTPSTALLPAHGSNAGGIIGHSTKGCTISGALEFNTEKISVASIAGNAGGCIGNIEGGATITGTVVTTGTGFGDDTLGTYNIFGTGNVGGVIGYSSKLTMKGIVSNSMSSLRILGAESTGGCIGQFSDGQISDTGIVNFSESDAVIRGTTNTGGCIGLLSASGVVYGKVLFQGKNNLIEGSSDNVGGVIGASIGKDKNTVKAAPSSSIRFLAEESLIKGQNNTGGVFGLVQNGKSNDSATISFSGVKSSVNGNDNVGGIIGQCNNYNHSNSIVQLSPGTSCTISGSNCVGGIMGLSVGDDTQFPNKAGNSEILLEGDVLNISGKEFVGGIIGKIDNKAHYSGSEIVVNGNSELNINSSDGIAGGLIGYMANMNLGGGTTLTMKCENSSVTINGKTAAGGLIGVVNGPIQGYFSMSVDSSSTFSVTASGDDAGAGGIAGINNSTIQRDNNVNGTVYIPQGGSISVKAEHGYAGGLLGINNGTFQYRSTYKFAINASVTDKTGFVTAPHLMVIGLKNGTDQYYTYIINGTEYAYNFTP